MNLPTAEDLWTLKCKSEPDRDCQLSVTLMTLGGSPDLGHSCHTLHPAPWAPSPPGLPGGLSQSHYSFHLHGVGGPPD